MRVSVFSTCIVIILLACGSTAGAQRYYRDSTFASSGLFIPASNSVPSYQGSSIKNIFVQPDNKILLACVRGATDLELLRLKPDGKVDSSFGTSGYFRWTPSGGSTVYTLIKSQLLSTGKIITLFSAVGTSSSKTLALCVNSNGTIDMTFGTGGAVLLSYSYHSFCQGVVEQPDKKLVFGGFFVSSPGTAFLLFRLKANGVVDSSFGQNGAAVCPYSSLSSSETSASILSLQNDGKIVFVCSAKDFASTNYYAWPLAIFRYKTNGTPDSSFGQNGYTSKTFDSTITNIAKVDFDNAGNIYTCGMLSQGSVALDPQYTYKPFIYKVSNSGNSVAGFGSTGLAVITKPLLAIAQKTGPSSSVLNYPVFLREASDRIIVASESDTLDTRYYRICRIDLSGKLDSTFCDSGVLNLPRGKKDQVIAGTLDRGGKVLLGGYTYYQSMLPPYKNDSMVVMCYRLKSPFSTTPPPLSVQSANQETSFSLYPNPSADGAFHIRSGILSSGTAVRLSLFDAMGRLVDEKTQVVNTSNGQLDYQTTQLPPPGIYVLHVTDASGKSFVTRVCISQ